MTFIISKMRIDMRFFKHMFMLVFLLITSRVGDATAEFKCKENERRALLKFKQALIDENGRLSSWNTSREENCCKWRGIKCSNSTGHVTGVDVHTPFNSGFVEFYSTKRLSGEVSPCLLELKYLNYLDLSFNDFGLVPFPKFIGSLSKLQYLNMSFINFYGPLPQNYGNLSNLMFLDLGYSLFSIKSLEWLSNYPLLTYLDLSGLELGHFDWLQAVSNLRFLTKLHLRDCKILGNVSLSLPMTNSSSVPPLTVIDLAGNYFDSFSSYGWLVNLSSRGYLVELSMSENHLGLVPEAIRNLVSLEILDLSYCEIKGDISNYFRNLTLLRSLELLSNKLSGDLTELFQSFPTDLEKSLEYLGLEGNNLTGSLPDFSRFLLLRELRLAHNALNGSFPESFAQISGLNFLDLSENKMTGSLPDLSFLPSLRELKLGVNKLSGNIPKSLGQLSKLQIFEAYANSFGGTISEAHFSTLSSLNELDLSWNNLTFEADSSWIPPFHMDSIRLASCKLGTQFPKWLKSQKNFSKLDISSAGISDTVPSWFWDLPTKSIQYLNISNNQLIGLIPADLHFYSFGGAIDFSRNILTGSVSFLCAKKGNYGPSDVLQGNYDGPSVVHLSDNRLSGFLPDCWTENQILFYLNLANNNFSGKIPNSIGLLPLSVLQLRNNSFVGELPLSLNNCTELKILDLALNKLSGEVPAWDFPELLVLSLRGNKFYGAIPPEMCQLRGTQVLDLSQNNISGNIPSCLQNLSSFVKRESEYLTSYMAFKVFTLHGDVADVTYATASVQWKGKESVYMNTLTLLRLIDLSGNKLVGNIPSEFGDLKELVSLNLSRNSLTGNIFKEIGEMKMLESIDFSRNHLSGEIPTSLSNLSFLSVLDLSNNNLSGKIPTSTQLQSFEASAYAANQGLCGPPLSNNCPGDEAVPVPPTIDHGKDKISQQDEDDKLIIPGFYISMILGFIVGFWGFCGPLLLRNMWRYAYFKKVEDTMDWICVTFKAKMAILFRS